MQKIYIEQVFNLKLHFPSQLGLRVLSGRLRTPFTGGADAQRGHGTDGWGGASGVLTVEEFGDRWSGRRLFVWARSVGFVFWGLWLRRSLRLNSI